MAAFAIPPDDALAGQPRVLRRGKYRRGEAGIRSAAACGSCRGDLGNACALQLAGRRQAGKRQAVPRMGESGAWQPVAGGSVFRDANFYAIRSYNPASNYALAILHLGDRIRGDGPFVQPFPGVEPTPTLAEVQEIQQRLTASGFDTDGTDGRVGRETMVAVRAFQRKVGLDPADGYAGLKVLARLRTGAR